MSTLAGEVTGPAGSNVVSNAVSANTANAIVRRGGGGSFSAGSITLSGNLNLPVTDGTNGFLTINGNRFLHAFGGNNTFVGDLAGSFTTGQANTGVGTHALNANTTGEANSAFGSVALSGNTSGSFNTAVGEIALANNTTGNNNSAVGSAALLNNNQGNYNTAVGLHALEFNTTGSFNTAIGASALQGNNPTAPGEGLRNTAVGISALVNNTTGSENIALGVNAGSILTTGDSNIDIGNVGVAGESNTIRIGTFQTKTFIAGIRGVTTTVNAPAIPVLIDSDGQLGTISSSRRVKQDIQEMGDATEALLQLRPVSFRYRAHGGSGPRQYGLIAEEVAEVFPDLVVYDKAGQPETVRYHELAPMLLNELQRQAQTIRDLQARVEQFERFLSLSAQRESRVPTLVQNGTPTSLTCPVSNTLQTARALIAPIP